MRRPGLTSATAALALAGTLTLTACTKSGPAELSTLPSNAAPAPGATISGTEPAVPGGAPVIVPPGSPPFCGQLASSAAIRGVPSFMTDLASPDTATRGVDGLRSAAQDLRLIAADANALAATLDSAARSLDHLADSGIDNTEAVDAAAAELSRLGQEVQQLCDFPLGVAEPSST